MTNVRRPRRPPLPGLGPQRRVRPPWRRPSRTTSAGPAAIHWWRSGHCLEALRAANVDRADGRRCGREGARRRPTKAASGPPERRDRARRDRIDLVVGGVDTEICPTAVAASPHRGDRTRRDVGPESPGPGRLAADAARTGGLGRNPSRPSGSHRLPQSRKPVLEGSPGPGPARLRLRKNLL